MSQKFNYSELHFHYNSFFLTLHANPITLTKKSELCMESYFLATKISNKKKHINIMTDKLFRPLVDNFLLIQVYTKNPTAWNYGMLFNNDNLTSAQLKYYSQYYFNLCIVDMRAIIRKGDVDLDLLNIHDDGVHKVSSEYIARMFNTCPTIKQDNLIYNRFPGCKPLVKIVASTDKSINLNNVPEDLINAWIEDPTIKIEDVFFIDGELQVELNENYAPHQ